MTQTIFFRIVLPSSIIFLLLSTFVTQAAEPIRIGLSLGLTGRYANTAKMQERAYRLWEAQTNEHGGILGRKVYLAIYDDKSNKDAARRIYLKMIIENKVDMLFSPYSSGITASILPITEKYGYPILAAGASADSIWQNGYKYVFGVYIPASRYTLGFIEMALTDNLTKLAIVTADDSFSLNVAKGTQKWATNLGLNLVFEETIKKGTTNLQHIAQKIKESGAQALVMCGHFDESVNMRQALKQINWYPKAYYASVGPVLQSYYDALKHDAEKTFSSTQWIYSEKLPFPGSRNFYRDFIAAYHIQPSYQAASAYAAGTILSSAITKVGSLDRDKIKDALATMDMMTLLGRYGVDRTGMQVRHFAVITQWIDAKKEVVWPEELRTKEPQYP